jgi:hypothetical protein
MGIDDLLAELLEVQHRVWFIHRISELDVTDDALRAHLEIDRGLFIQVFLSEATGRCSFALVQGSQRIYGLDREGGAWHRHPYEDPKQHEFLPEGASPYALRQFVAEVEQILVTGEFI